MITRGADSPKSASAPAAARNLGVLRRFESPIATPGRSGLLESRSAAKEKAVMNYRTPKGTWPLDPSSQKGRDFPDFGSQLGPGKGGRDLPHPTGFGQAWPKLAKTGQTWTQVAKYGQGWPNLDSRWTAFPALLRRHEHPAECKAKTRALFLPCFARFSEIAHPLAGLKRGKMGSGKPALSTNRRIYRPPPSKWTINTAKSAGVIPLIRPAWAKSIGRTRSNFSRASARR